VLQSAVAGSSLANAPCAVARTMTPASMVRCGRNRLHLPALLELSAPQDALGIAQRARHADAGQERLHPAGPSASCVDLHLGAPHAPTSWAQNSPTVRVASPARRSSDKYSSSYPHHLAYARLWGSSSLSRQKQASLDAFSFVMPAARRDTGAP
jgi:hypothetical protein